MQYTTKTNRFEDGEYRVRLFANGAHVADADYFTDCAEDAKETALAMVAHAEQARALSAQEQGAELERLRILDECEAIGNGGSLVRTIDANLGNGVRFRCAPLATFPNRAQRVLVTIDIPECERWTFLETDSRAEILECVGDAIAESRGAPRCEAGE